MNKLVLEQAAVLGCREPKLQLLSKQQHESTRAREENPRAIFFHNAWPHFPAYQISKNESF